MTENKSMGDIGQLMKDLSDVGALYPNVIDFIIADRKRIVKPIFAYKLSVIEIEQNWGLRKSDIAINQTLKNAGVE